MQAILRTRLVTALVLVVVFGAGAVTGVAFDRGMEGRRHAPDHTADARPTPMYMKVNPTAQQKVLIDSILRDHRAAFRKLHEEFRANYDPRYQALIKETREAIDSVLTTEQAAKYDSLLAESDRKRAERAPRQNRE
jgi:hypothetical protein